jgi:hypothetical protein
MIEYWTTTEQAQRAIARIKQIIPIQFFSGLAEIEAGRGKKKVIGVREHGENAKTIQILHASTYFLSTVFFNNILYIIK